MRMSSRLILLAAAAAACSVGPSARMFRPAQQPHGTQARIRVGTSRYIGELLDVRDTALVVLQGDRVLLAQFGVLREATFPQVGVALRSGTPVGALLDQLRLVSRFPQGLTPDLERRVLAAYGQDSIVVLRP